MAIRAVADPPHVLYRIGRRGSPLSFVPWEISRTGRFDSRFDDPRGEFRVLYAAETLLACFVETLANFRPSIELLATLQRTPDGDNAGVEPVAGFVGDWRHNRSIGILRLLPDQRWADLRSLETRETLRVELASTLLSLGWTDLDLSDALGRSRPLTQAIARWLYERGWHGIAYASRFNCSFHCWAIFEGARFEEVDDPTAGDGVAADHPGFVECGRLLGLNVN
jgi:hypothetical protein